MFVLFGIFGMSYLWGGYVEIYVGPKEKFLISFAIFVK